MYQEFNDWLRANGFAPESITADQKPALQAAWRAHLGGPTPVPTPAPVPTPTPTPTPVKGADATFAEKSAAIEEEGQRVEYIREATERAMLEYARLGNTAKVQQLRELGAAAMGDEKVDRRAFDLALIRAGRPDVGSPLVRANPEADAAAVEAAVCRSGGLPDLESHFDTRTLETSERHFRGGLGLQDLVGIFARKNGWRGSSLKAAFNSPALLRAAFRGAEDHYDLRAGPLGPSTYSLPVILSNVANKFLRVGFESVDQAWTRIAATRSVSDFKQISTAALTGSLLFREVPPGGELQHGDISERSYTNQANTQGLLLGIDLRDLINDDLGALTGAGRRMGRGGALRLNQMFWTIFLNNSTFFSSGNANVLTGTTAGPTNSVLSLEGLANADRVFRLQTDPDGQPLGVFPTILLVPSALRIPALNLMNSTTVVASNTAQTTVLSPANNVLAGAYEVVSTPYMSNAAFTGNSSTAWYLLASPADMPTVEVVFLNGVATPTVETTEADFNTLGIALRGYIDAGVAMQEYRGGVRAAGA